MTPLQSATRSFLELIRAELEAQGRRASQPALADLLGVTQPRISAAWCAATPGSWESLETWCERWVEQGGCPVRIVREVVLVDGEARGRGWVERV